MTNNLDRPLTNAMLVAEGRVLTLGNVPAGKSKTFQVERSKGVTLHDFVTRHQGEFQAAVTARQRAFGSSSSGQIPDITDSSMAASFLSQIAQDQNGYNYGFVSPPGLDLTPVAERANAVLLAWSADYSPMPPINKFHAAAVAQGHAVADDGAAAGRRANVKQKK